MPRGDKTGPEEAGFMTRRKAHKSIGNDRTGRKRNPVQGRCGGAQLRGWGFHAFPRDYRTEAPPKTDINRTALEAEREVLRGQLDETEQQLSVVDAKEKTK